MDIYRYVNFKYLNLLNLFYKVLSRLDVVAKGLKEHDETIGGLFFQ